MKRILYLSDNNLNTLGGSQRSIATIIKELTKTKKYHISLFMPAANEDFSLCKVYYYKRCKRFWLFHTFIYKLLKLLLAIKKEKPDIVHAQNMECGMLLGILKKMHLINKKITCIYTDRGFLGTYSKKYYKMFKKVAKYFDHIITTTDINKNEWSKIVDNIKIQVISNVLDEKWNEFDINKKKKDNKIILGFAGRYEKIKRWDLVDKICEKFIDNDNYIFSIVITGEGKDEYLNQMKKKYNKQIIIKTDLDEKQMEDFYYSIDMYILTSEGESFGRTLLEAMSKENVVFGTNSGGVPSVIQNDEFIYNVGDIEHIYQQILKYSDLKNRKEAINYFKKLYLNNYTIASLVTKHNKIYLEK